MSFERDDPSTLFRICFVCTGNICRSPMAAVVLQQTAERAGYGRAISVQSAGTGEWHVGEPADPRTTTALADRGYDAVGHRARQFDADWFDDLDLVVVFDRGQERIVRSWARDEAERGKVQRLLSFDSRAGDLPDVPDPYYSDPATFAQVLDTIEHATVALFRQIMPGIRPGVR